MKKAVVNPTLTQISKHLQGKVKREQRQGTQAGQSVFDRIPTPEKFQEQLEMMRISHLNTINESPIESQLELHYKVSQDSKSKSKIDLTDPPARKITGRSKSSEKMSTIEEIDSTAETVTYNFNSGKPLRITVEPPQIEKSISWANLFEDPQHDSYAEQIKSSIPQRGL
ncbi:MAG: hypothetical protein PQ612_00895 [Rickettsiales bacterium]|nr:hypothetical protein [Pseudomonadota bacterium]MDA0965528.1 hypothetical protein [Pseudomonadota bacterium]MDG4542852.1 hypothetical protein [Rickettsiales bacterium]MDG4544700.1 hypothetical protein [Rickettsiales bacterium]MDG4546822.1 hypothetical protein [Rickettsiales bacterium]